MAAEYYMTLQMPRVQSATIYTPAEPFTAPLSFVTSTSTELQRTSSYRYVRAEVW